MQRERTENGGELRIERFGPGNRAAFERLHGSEGGGCHCVAWWTEGWESWGERTAEQNAALRQSLCTRGEYDGYLAWSSSGPGSGAEPIAWCQVGPRDRLEKLVRQFELAPAPRTWAVTCLLVRPEARAAGVAREFLRAVLLDLGQRDVERVEAFPRRAREDGRSPDALDLWSGPEALFLGAGFRVVRDDALRPVLALESPGSAAPATDRG